MDYTHSGKATESDDISIPGRLELRGGSTRRGLIGLLLAACIFAAASRHSRPMVARPSRSLLSRLTTTSRLVRRES